MGVFGEIFKKDANGRVIELSSVVVLSPSRENSFKILFGGNVLTSMDEISGNLATLFVGSPDRCGMHVGEAVLFEEPIETGEIGMVVARVAYGTEKIIVVYIAVYGGKPQEPNNFTLRYEGFGLCAVFDLTDPNRAIVRDLDPYADPDYPELVERAKEELAHQRDMRKKLKAMRAAYAVPKPTP